MHPPTWYHKPKIVPVDPRLYQLTTIHRKMLFRNAELLHTKLQYRIISCCKGDVAPFFTHCSVVSFTSSHLYWLYECSKCHSCGNRWIILISYKIIYPSAKYKYKMKHTSICGVIECFLPCPSTRRVTHSPILEKTPTLWKYNVYLVIFTLFAGRKCPFGWIYS